MLTPSPFAAARDGLRLTVRLTPRASSNQILGLAKEADGGVALKVAVTAAPEAGKANDALIKLLAKELRLPQRDFTLVLGATDRRKVVHIAGDSAALTRHFAEVLCSWLRQG